MLADLLVLMPISFGEAPEHAPWAIQREDRPAAFGRVLLLTVALGIGYPFPTHASILSHSDDASHQPVLLSDAILGNLPETVETISGKAMSDITA